MTRILTSLTERFRQEWLAFLLGMIEFRTDFTWADPRRGSCSMTDLDYAYDDGREFAHRVTMRKWDC